VTDFAFPFGKPGDCTGITGDDLASSGYRSAVTTISGTNRPGINSYNLRRVSFGEQSHLALFAYQLNNLFLQAEEPSIAPPTLEASRTPPAIAVSERRGE
jgi:hypothetical protein